MTKERETSPNKSDVGERIKVPASLAPYKDAVEVQRTVSRTLKDLLESGDLDSDSLQKSYDLIDKSNERITYRHSRFSLELHTQRFLNFLAMDSITHIQEARKPRHDTESEELERVSKETLAHIAELSQLLSLQFLLRGKKELRHSRAPRIEI